MYFFMFILFRIEISVSIQCIIYQAPLSASSDLGLHCLPMSHLWDARHILVNYTPGIYAEGYIVFVLPFVRLYVRSFVCSFVCSFVISSHSWNYFEVLCSSNSSGVYLTNHSSESIHIWTIGTLEGPLITWLLTPGSMPWGGARGQNLGHL